MRLCWKYSTKDFASCSLTSFPIFTPQNKTFHYMMKSIESFPTSTSRISLILSIFSNLISDYQLSSSPSLVHTLQPQITIPAIFEYLSHRLKNDMQHLWIVIMSFVLIMLRQHPGAIVEINPTTAMTFIKKMMEQINVLPVKLSKGQMRCVEKGQEVIEAFLTGKGCGGVGCVSYYHIIQEVSYCLPRQITAVGKLLWY
jgi:hypothetical protein